MEFSIPEMRDSLKSFFYTGANVEQAGFQEKTGLRPGQRGTVIDTDLSRRGKEIMRWVSAGECLSCCL